jgi:hypothetical protein
MDLSVLKLRGAGAFAALLASTIFGAGSLQAVQVVNATVSGAVTCNTATGPGTSATVTVKLGTGLVGSASLVVTLGAPGNGLVVTPSTPQTFLLAQNTSGVIYTVSAAPGCVGNSTGNTTLAFTAPSSTAGSAIVADTVTATTSALTAQPVTIQCIAGGTPGRSQTVTVTSAATGGTPFTADPSGGTAPDAALAAWATITPGTPSGTANSTGVSFSVVATGSGVCGGYALNSTHTTYLYLDNAPAPAAKVAISITVVAASTLSVTYAPTSKQLTYLKGSESPGYVDVSVTSTPAALTYSIANLPTWLTTPNSSHGGPWTFRFSSSSICDTLAPGTYTGTFYLTAFGYADTPVTITMLLTNKAPTLSVNLASSPGLVTTGATASTPTNQNIIWSYGSTTLPTPVITLVSSDSPISYTTTVAGALGPIVSAVQSTSVAFSFGTPVNVSFNPSVFSSSSPGNTLTGTVTFTYGSPATSVTVTINVIVQSPGALITSVSPASIPTGSAGQSFPVILSGSGFVNSVDPTQRTKVGISIGGISVFIDSNINGVQITNSSISFNIAVPSVTDTYLPFASGGQVNIGVCNPTTTGTCVVSAITMQITPGPIVQAVTSASAFTEVAPGTLPVTSAYDMLSVFGQSFCTSGGTGCSSTQILYGLPDATSDRYPLYVSPDSGASPRNLTATFYAHGIGGAFIGNAPILFANNTQMNILVPAAVINSVTPTLYTSATGLVDLVVNFGTGAPPSALSVEAASATSAIFNMTIVNADPGIFTVGADGQGTAAILDASTYAEITQANPAGMNTVGSNSQTVALYVTGLGLPDSVAANTTGGTNTNVTDCIAATGAGATVSYEGALQAAIGASPVLTNIDGAVIQQSLIDPSRLPPCMASSPSGTIPAVTIGGIAVTTVGYSGFVDSAVAGLYQVNVTLPLSSAAFKQADGVTVIPFTNGTPVQMPVVVTSQGLSSQPGVSIWVAPRLTVTAPVTLGYTIGSLITVSASTGVTVVGGNGTYTGGYTLTGTLPPGMTFSNATGRFGGTPTGSGMQYIETVNAADTNSPAVTGSVTFTLTVNPVLALTASPAGPFTGYAAASVLPVTTITAANGDGTYVYGHTVTIGAGTGSIGDVTFDVIPVAGSYVVALANTSVSGTTYHVVVTAHDTTAPVQLTGGITFDIVVP